MDFAQGTTAPFLMLSSPANPDGSVFFSKKKRQKTATRVGIRTCLRRNVVEGRSHFPQRHCQKQQGQSPRKTGNRGKSRPRDSFQHSTYSCVLVGALNSPTNLPGFWESARCTVKSTKPEGKRSVQDAHVCGVVGAGRVGRVGGSDGAGRNGEGGHAR